MEMEKIRLDVELGILEIRDVNSEHDARFGLSPLHWRKVRSR